MHIKKIDLLVHFSFKKLWMKVVFENDVHDFEICNTIEVLIDVMILITGKYDNFNPKRTSRMDSG